MRIAYSYIRFSSKKQQHGTSYKRQLELTTSAAIKNGWKLEDIIFDKGVSGFKGKNVEFGELGSFIQLVKHGKIKQNSILIVENLDRISRQNYRKAITLFQEILDLNIDIYVLPENKLYTKSLIDDNLFELFSAASTFLRANEESKTKSDRALKNWEYKRDLISKTKKPYTKNVPKWLTIKDDKFVIDTKVQTIIQRVFNLYKEGYGRSKIATLMNTEKIKTFEGKLWHTSTVADLISNRKLIGELQFKQPNTNGDSKFKNVGDVIPDYYPIVIDPKLFNECQAIKESNRSVIKGGKTGKAVNLFTGLLKCGKCGASYVLMDKGAWKSLLCYSSVNSKTSCDYISIPYYQFEKNILSYLKELDLQNLFNNNNDVLELRSKLLTIDHTIDYRTKQIDKLLDSFNDDDDMIDIIKNKVKKINDEIKVLKKDKEDISNKINESDNLKNVDVVQNVEDYYSTIDNMGDEDKVALRLKMRQLLHLIIDRIEIKSIAIVSIQKLKSRTVVENKKELKDHMQYIIFLKNGIIRSIQPDFKYDVEAGSIKDIESNNISNLDNFKKELQNPNKSL